MQAQLVTQPFKVQLNWLTDAPVVLVNIDALTAKRRVSGWAGGEVAHSCRGSMPTLMFKDQQIFWRVPVEFTQQGHGIVGEIGVVMLDAETGQMDVSDALAETMQLAAAKLAESLEASSAHLHA